MNKLVRKTTALVFALVVPLLFGGCSRGPGNAIESVLNRCADHTQYVNHSGMSAAQAAQFLATEMQKLDTRDCPPDFRTAFQQHINAWRDAAGHFAQNSPLNSFLEGMAAGFFQDPSMFGISQQNAAAASQNINATYNQLVTIAVAHGARVPESIIK